MPYCKRCGELGRAAKCQKCGTSLLSNPAATPCDSSKDRWQSSKYLDQVVGEVQEGAEDRTINGGAIPRTRTSKMKLQERRKIPSILFDKKCRITPLPSISTTSQPSPLGTNECTTCHKVLTGKVVQLPHDSDGPGKRYHWSCINCHHCHKPFQTTGVYLDPHKNAYHLKCVGISPSDEKSCHRCDQAIDNQYLNIHLFVLHPECFRCTSCQVELKPASLYSLHHQYQGSDQNKLSNYQIHCSACHPHKGEQKEWQIVPQPQQVQYPTKQLTYHPASQPHTPISSSSPFDKVQPSDLMGSKKYGTHRPQFGTVKVCPGCTDRITSVHDERTGPRAAKWHRQCLVCCSCQKVLDSSAKVHQDSESDRLVPSCTTCLLQKKNTNQKRNSVFIKEWCKT